MTLSIGQAVPGDAFQTDGNNTLKLTDFKGKPVILYFYPKDDTPGCTLESCGFRDVHQQLSTLGIQVIGVSRDDVKSHDKFKAKYELNFPLIADTDDRLSTAFGVLKEKSMYGRKYMGIERSTFLIDAEGVIQKEWRAVSVPGHVDAVVEAAKALL
ncbi:MAG: peroxiredoxin [Holosporales bacterium]